MPNCSSVLSDTEKALTEERGLRDGWEQTAGDAYEHKAKAHMEERGLIATAWEQTARGVAGAGAAGLTTTSSGSRRSATKPWGSCLTWG